MNNGVHILITKSFHGITGPNIVSNVTKFFRYCISYKNFMSGILFLPLGNFSRTNGKIGYYSCFAVFLVLLDLRRDEFGRLKISKNVKLLAEQILSFLENPDFSSFWLWFRAVFRYPNTIYIHLWGITGGRGLSKNKSVLLLSAKHDEAAAIFSKETEARMDKILKIITMQADRTYKNFSKSYVPFFTIDWM